MQGQSVGKVDANTLLFRFIKDNNIALNVEVLDEQASFAGDGFVLTDKPLLKITAKYKEAVNV